MPKKTLKLALSFALCCASSTFASDIIENIPAYHNNSKWQKISARETFDQFYSHHQLTGQEALLDVCSGDGKISHYFSEKLREGTVVGLDISKPMIQFSRMNYGDDHTSFVQMDAQSISYVNQFDIVTSFTCLHLVPDTEKTFEGIERSLKPGGIVLLQFPFDHGLVHALSTILESKKWRPYFSSFKAPWFFLSPERYKQQLIQANLTPLRVEITQMHEVYVSRGEFQTSIGHWLPHVNHLAIPLRDEFMDDLISEYFTYMATDEKGYIHYFVDRIEIEARKES